MADFTDQDKDLLDRLRKAFESTAQTTLSRQPWQEHLSRDTSVVASRSLLAAKVLDGFSGSWAAQFQYGSVSVIAPVAGGPEEPVSDVDAYGSPTSVRAKTNKLGQRGFPEINFVPYNARTNAFGFKGPSLVGHPISFEVVGPTLKSPFTSWTWRVEEGAGPNGGDLLTQDVQPDGSPSPISNDIWLMYGPSSGVGPWVIGTSDEPNGGLYLLVSDDGVNPGSLAGGQTPMGALPKFLDTARYELFRISEITATSIEIHPNKRLSTFFDLPSASTRWIRAITLVRPYVTRLAAIPGSGSGVGQERTFAVVTPEVAASGDTFPPYDGGNGIGSGDGSWIGGGFTESLAPGSGAATGSPLMYGGKVRQPIPLPIIEAFGTVQSGLGLPPLPVGIWGIETPAAPFTDPAFASEFPIVKVSSTTRDEDLEPFFGFGYPTACLGWFDVQNITIIGPSTAQVGRVPETNPNLGLTYFGPGPFVVKAPGPSQNVTLGLTLHQSVSELWRGNFNLDKVEACRLTILIDPRWGQRFEKQVSFSASTPPPGASGAGRPDKSLWGTRAISTGGPIPEAENPGNLMDLGFRMVLYPAKRGGVDDAVPDFDSPITGRNVLIDPAVTEEQYIDIDYAAGIVRLSHAPPTSSLGDIVPNGIVGLAGNNPRGEVVLFAACVPYSMEDSQLGAGTRVTADFGGTRDIDLYSPQTFAQMDLTHTTFVGSAPFIGPSTFGPVEIVLDRIWDGPETGVITVTSGGIAGLPFGRWGYTSKITRVNSGGLQVTALGGISSLPAVLNPTPAGGQQRGVVLRREVIFTTESPSIPSLDPYPLDTTYGSSARASVLRFLNASLRGEADGSITVDPRPDFSLFEQAYGSAMPSKLEYPIGNVSFPGPTGNFLGEQGLLCGMLYQTLASTDGVGGLYLTNFTSAGIPAIQFSPSPIAPAAHGVITKGSVSTPLSRGIIRLTDSFRSVTRVSFQIRDVTDTHKYFVGFVQDEGAPFVDPTIGDVTNVSTMDPRYTAIGLAIDMTIDNNIYFWTRGSAGDFFVPTGQTMAPVLTVAGTTEPYYFVIETRYDKRLYQPPDTSAIAGGVEVRMGLYNSQKVQLAGTVVTSLDRLPTLDLGVGRGLFYAAGAQTVAPNNSNPALNFHGTTLVLDSWKPRLGAVLARP